MSYTTGPWSYAPDAPCCWQIQPVPPNVEESRLAVVWREADAQLIACAPDLLAALQDMTDRFELVCRTSLTVGFSPTIAAVTVESERRLIARARGETP